MSKSLSGFKLSGCSEKELKQRWEWARAAMTPRSCGQKMRNGVPILPPKVGETLVTSEVVAQLAEDNSPMSIALAVENDGCLATLDRGISIHAVHKAKPDNLLLLPA